MLIYLEVIFLERFFANTPIVHRFNLLVLLRGGGAEYVSRSNSTDFSRDEFISGWLISEDLFSIPEKQSNDVINRYLVVEGP